MDRHDPAWLDRQYNNRARIPEHAEIFERWDRASALAIEGQSRRLDVRYGDGPSETLDIYPTTAERAPVFVFIHGGYWRAFDKSNHAFVAPDEHEHRRAFRSEEHTAELQSRPQLLCLLLLEKKKLQ